MPPQTAADFLSSARGKRGHGLEQRLACSFGRVGARTVVEWKRPSRGASR